MGKLCAVILILILLIGCSPPVETYPARELRIEVTDSRVADWCECDVLAFVTNVETKGTVSFCYDDGMCCLPEEEPEYGTLHILILPKNICELKIVLTDRDGLSITWHP
jgi:hypothetical protein